MTRLPNALAGALSVLVLALLGRRLFGRAVGLVAAALGAVSVTLVGYQRVAKEDTLLCLFMMGVFWCMAEAKAAAEDGRADEQRRWELGGAVGIGLMLASKYFFFLAFIPLVFYGWVRGTGTAWRVTGKRWAALTGIAAVVFVAFNPAPFMPASWAYWPVFLKGGESVHGSILFMGRVYDSHVERGIYGTPPWFYVVFTLVKLTPATFLLAMGGLGVALKQRLPAHRLVLAWLGLWFLVHSALGGKFGRYYLSALPAFLLLAASCAMLIAERAPRVFAGRGGALAGGVLVLLMVGGEAQAALTYAPHDRLYISPLGGGEARVGWYFPHCDYFDAGYREAMIYIAEHAEPGAEVSSELAYKTIMPAYPISALYPDLRGREDLLHTQPRPDRACLSGKVCYVVVQVGRLYLSNEAIVAALAKRVPWHVEQIRGVDVVKVYRLEPGEHLPTE
jgi:4-amino-4-deoxy-L-arabinose transferase-like glycosyltransferase